MRLPKSLTRGSALNWARRVAGRRDVHPDVVSLYDAHTAHHHLDSVIPVQEAQYLRSDAERATPSELRRLLPGRQAYWLKNVHVWADEGIITTPEGALVAETLPSHYRFVKMLRAGAYNRSSHLKESIDVVDTCTSLGGGRYFGNHYHRLIDEIPRLFALHSIGDVPHVAIPSQYPDALQEIIQPLLPEGVETHVARDRKQWISVNRYLYLPTVTDDYCGYLPHGFVQALRGVVERMLGVRDDSKPHRKAYIARSGTTRRRIRNESAVIQMLSARGFETVRGDEMGLKDQIRLFRDVDCIVGAHGAGLTNMMFSPKCTVIELFPGAPFTHYRWLSESLGHEYRNVVGDPDVGKHADFEVDLSALENALDDR